MNSELAHSIYALLTFLGGRLIYETVKSLHRKHTMLVQLKNELENVLLKIEINRQKIEKIDKESASWPMLTLLDISIHEAQIGRLITSPALGKTATQFISNCKHYNRIIVWGDNGVFNRFGLEFTKSKRNDVSLQGSLIINKDGRLFLKNQDGERTGTHKGYGEEYQEVLDAQLKSRYKFLKWIPWLSYFYISHHGDDTNSSNHAGA